MELYISNESTASDKAYVRNKMHAFNSAHFPAELKGRYQEVNLFVKDAKGQLFGGILSEICWNWLEVHYLYVSEELRKAGFGSKLMAEVERITQWAQVSPSHYRSRSRYAVLLLDWDLINSDLCKKKRGVKAASHPFSCFPLVISLR